MINKKKNQVYLHNFKNSHMLTSDREYGTHMSRLND